MRLWVEKGPIVVIQRTLVFLACVAAAAISATAGAQTITVKCSVSEARVMVGDAVDYLIQVSGSNTPEQPEINAPDNAELTFAGGSNQSSHYVGQDSRGRRVERSELGYIFQYQLTVTAPGEIVIPAPRVKVNGTVYTGNEVRLRAAEPERSDDYGLRVSVDNPTPYVGQPITLRLEWKLAGNVKDINISRLPGLERFDVATPRDRVPVGGQQADPTRVEFQMFGRPVLGTWSQGNGASRVLTVEQAIVPKEPGDLSLGAMSIGFKAVVGQRPRDFFDSFLADRDVVKKMAVRSEPVTIRVKPLPERGRPDGFSGLVGKYSLHATATPTEVGVGDPIQLSVTADGPDPLERVPAPALAQIPAFGDSFRLSPEGWNAAGAGPRRFTTSVRVTAPNVAAIPSIELAYFDPETGEYRTARTDPIPLRVRATKVVTAADGIGGASAGGGVPTATTALEFAPPGLLANTRSLGALRSESGSLLDVVRSPTGIAVIAAPIGVYGAALVAAHRRGRSPDRRRILTRALDESRRQLRICADESGVAAAFASYIAAASGRAADSLVGEEMERLIERLAPKNAERARVVLRASDAGRFGNTPAELGTLRTAAEDALIALHSEVCERQDREVFGLGGQS